eukprot:4287997-Pyramimonas_sp.AAC.1
MLCPVVSGICTRLGSTCRASAILGASAWSPRSPPQVREGGARKTRSCRRPCDPAWMEWQPRYTGYSWPHDM